MSEKGKAPVISSLTTKDQGTITHYGAAAFTVTAQVNGTICFTQIEYSTIPDEVMQEMVAVLLCMLDDLRGEQFIASCFGRYAQETGKKFFEQENGRKLILIRGK